MKKGVESGEENPGLGAVSHKKGVERTTSTQYSTT
jgi:hypothetical protein